MHPRSYTIKTFLTAASLTLLAAVPAAAQQPLYTVGNLATPARSAAAVDERVITVSDQFLTATVQQLEVELLNGLRVVATRDMPVEVRGINDLTWRGLIDGTHRITLTRKGRLVAGYFDTDIGPHSILPGQRGIHTLALLDGALFGDCGNDGNAPVSIGNSMNGLGSSYLAPDNTTDSTNGANPDEVAILALYTPQARDKVGGQGPIQVLIQGAIDLANTAFIDSQSIMRFKRVHTAQANYNDSVDSLADIQWLETSAQVSNLRNQFGADLVGLMVGDLQAGVCGEATDVLTNLAGNPDIAYQVTEARCSFDNLVFAHEFGHLVGMNHDPDFGLPASQAIRPWAFGHSDPLGFFRTVMAQGGQCMLGLCQRVPHFSNPDVDHNGVPTGIANQRDNARVADELVDNVAGYRTATGAPSLVASYIPSNMGPRTEFASQSSNPPAFEFYYNEFNGNFDEQPGGVCHDDENNTTYLKLRYEGPAMASCTWQFSYGGSSPVNICSTALRNFLNSHAEAIIRTDRFAIDINPGSPNFCGLEQPLRDFLKFNTTEWVKLNLVTTSGQSVNLRVNFRKTLEGPF